jgi:UDP-N-acetylmuramate dehydrogenase
MNILSDYDLSELNTFHVPARAKFFVEIRSESDLPLLFSKDEFKNNPQLFLGGGSNVLFTKDFDGIVILNKLKGIEILEENKDDVVVRSMSGVVWHDLVLFAVELKYWGIENLSFVPGTVGAAPMQNIGAYGAELKNVLENVEAVEISTGIKKVFSREECELGYRESIFKNTLKGKYFITAVTLRLSKKEQKNISYKVLREHLEENKVNVQEPKDISDAVTHIRKTKLPDPNVLGNAGSFFKNVFVDEGKLQDLLKLYPEMPYFTEGGIVKIPSGWLIEQCGPAKDGTSWKGYRVGNVGVHERQALVLVNHGGASGLEIKALADEVIDAVFKKFGLTLTPEVNLI